MRTFGSDEGTTLRQYALKGLLDWIKGDSRRCIEIIENNEASLTLHDVLRSTPHILESRLVLEIVKQLSENETVKNNLALCPWVINAVAPAFEGGFYQDDVVTRDTHTILETLASYDGVAVFALLTQNVSEENTSAFLYLFRNTNSVNRQRATDALWTVLQEPQNPQDLKILFNKEIIAELLHSYPSQTTHRILRSLLENSDFIMPVRNIEFLMHSLQVEGEDMYTKREFFAYALGRLARHPQSRQLIEKSQNVIPDLVLLYRYPGPKETIKHYAEQALAILAAGSVATREQITIEFRKHNEAIPASIFMGLNINSSPSATNAVVPTGSCRR